MSGKRDDVLRRRCAVGVGVVAGVLLVFACKGMFWEWWCIRCLQAENEESRRWAAEVLGDLKSVKSVPELLNVVRREPDPLRDFSELPGEVDDLWHFILIPEGHGGRYMEIHYAARALENIGDASLRALVEAVEDSNFQMRAQALHTLYRMGASEKIVVDAFVRQLRRKRQDLCTLLYTLLALENLGEKATDALPALLEYRDNHPELSFGVSQVIDSIVKRGVDGSR